MKEFLGKLNFLPPLVTPSDEEPIATGGRQIVSAKKTSRFSA
jgi:hypothetical protein